MAITETLKISSVELVNQTSLQITFVAGWYQEDIPLLTSLVLSLLKDHYLIETTQGADREYTRFKWQDDYFILNFECYSESCWIENETKTNTPLLNLIKQYIETP
ncbi:DUF3630 family protein [Pseudocolwellia agarivorans]|mgnify:CR=1 FL=1|uniref:DUF3630 family protein n=1 Tax=Pseudocolwellia agarivorans TaxID=1911682 RepID=UPI00098423CC|nr:DUF3630 family protein [Pseudocolwellia agarivorans]